MNKKKESSKRPHAISFAGATSLVKQSFKDECDVNKIVDRFTRTGQIDHLARQKPQYGDAPDQNFFEAACMVAETASAVEEGLPGVDDLKTPENGSEDDLEPNREPEPAPEVPDPDDGDGTNA